MSRNRSIGRPVSASTTFPRRRNGAGIVTTISLSLAPGPKNRTFWPSAGFSTFRTTTSFGAFVHSKRPSASVSARQPNTSERPLNSGVTRAPTIGRPLVSRTRPRIVRPGSRRNTSGGSQGPSLAICFALLGKNSGPRKDSGISIDSTASGGFTTPGGDAGEAADGAGAIRTGPCGARAKRRPVVPVQSVRARWRRGRGPTFGSGGPRSTCFAFTARPGTSAVIRANPGGRFSN